MNRNNQNGNILIFLLIAIVLLGGLTALLTRSGGSTNETGEYERQSISASDLLKYASGIEQAVQKLQQFGCSENQISFDQAVVTGYSHLNSPTDNSCHVFETAGGGQVYESANTGLLDSAASGETHYGEWVFSGANEIQDIGTTAASNASAEMVIMLPFVDQDICTQINRTLDIGSTIPQDSGSMDIALQYAGAFSYQQTISNAAINGKKSFCIQGNTDDSGTDISDYYFFISVLKGR
jgi:hypothetical protein